MNSNKDISPKNYFDLTPWEHEAIAQRAVKKAIERMHSKGIPTVEVTEDGVSYLHHPDGTRTPILDKENNDATK